ncbi:DUF488 family protein [Mucilaginibacter sp. OK098]|uniref:DUF488 domain-containing protein n=1 Tax=Mucilaginibacter sp. OK098 TaxID=1855297 RepID=UPI001F384C24|nr:DUF488 domain-containing protein [Mucilaginibacter sp. OK098]
MELFEGKLEKIRLQKLLFLFSKRQTEPEYEFIPYKYGCFSFSAQADLVTMVNKGLLIDDQEGLTKNDTVKYFAALKADDQKALAEIKKLYGAMNGAALMRHTYVNYPYFALNSVKATEILTPDELDRVKAARPWSEKTTLFTIGYEGISLEHYINKLIRNDVKVLVDVRKNPLSMKYGFSKSLLKKFCDSVGIEYVHIPEVGIDSDQRQELNTQQDYDQLFRVYKKENLVATKDVQSKILELLKVKKRIALTCFEANICQCHRKPLAESIAALSKDQFELKHI